MGVRGRGIGTGRASGPEAVLRRALDEGEAVSRELLRGRAGQGLIPSFALSFALLVTCAGQAAAQPKFTFKPAHPGAGTAVRLEASASLCSAAPCRYVWESSGASLAGRLTRLGTGRHIRTSFAASGVQWVRLAGRRLRGSRR